MKVHLGKDGEKDTFQHFFICCPLTDTIVGEIKEEIKVEPDFPPSPPPSSAGSTSSLCNTELWASDGIAAVQEEAKVSPEPKLACVFS